MDAKENLLRVISHDQPQWVPYDGDGVIKMLNPPVVERPLQAALDDFGVKWLFNRAAEGGELTRPKKILQSPISGPGGVRLKFPTWKKWIFRR